MLLPKAEVRGYGVMLAKRYKVLVVKMNNFWNSNVLAGDDSKQYCIVYL